MYAYHDKIVCTLYESHYLYNKKLFVKTNPWAFNIVTYQQLFNDF